MTQKNIKNWFVTNNKGLILGFIFGALVAPFIASFGLVIYFIEILGPVLLGPMRLLVKLIPSIWQYPYSVYEWILALGFNGICYALLGGIIQSIIRLIKTKNINQIRNK